MDSFELNKIIGAVLMTALIVIGINKLSDVIFHVKKPEQSAYKVEGVELSEKMVKKAKNSSNFSCFQGDIREVRTGKKYDTVISLFHVLNYQTTNKDLTDVFVSANKHLQKDGLFIFDSWYTPAVINQIPEVRIKRMSNNELNVIRIAEPTIPL